MNRLIAGLAVFLVMILSCTSAQNQEQENTLSELPYYEIPENPSEYTAETVAARMVDGLGFRYYWATEGLREEDLSYKPSEDARTTDQTLDHILGLTSVLLNAVQTQPNIRPSEQKELTFDEKRRQTLENIKKASDLLKASEPGALESYKMVFQNPDRTSEYPFWNLINGPISDALWHVGQVVSFRRSSGNPFNSRASVLRGKLRDEG